MIIAHKGITMMSPINDPRYMTTLNIRISQSSMLKILDIAKRRRITVSDCVKEMVDLYIFTENIKK